MRSSLLLLLLGCGLPVDDTASPDLCAETPVGEVSLPSDDTVHDQPVEWWYWTGHLVDDAGAHYGFEEVFFLFDFGGSSRHMLTNVALTDEGAQSFLYDASYNTDYTPVVVEDGFAFVDGVWSAEGGDGHDALVGSVATGSADAGGADGYAWDLQLDSTKAPVLQHGDGYTDYDFGGNTWYYSRPRMDVAGTLQTGAGALAVTGTAWFDHQWGNLLPATSIGWDWFALQLDDGRDVMLFFVRDGATPSMVGGSVSNGDCEVTELAADAVSATSTGSWTSDVSGCTWPAGWTVTVDGETFTVTPTVADQELYSDEDTYWEGEVTVTGAATGRGYVELTGYCE